MILQTRVIFSLSPGYYFTFNKITAFTRDLCFSTHLQYAFHDSAVTSNTVVSGVKMDTVMLLLIAQNTKSNCS